jgi:hypothetical protein
MATTSNLPAKSVSLRVNKSAMLEDNAQWTNRFEIHSASSDRVYIIAQNKDKGHMGCSCPGWRTRRNCKHLSALGLPGYEVPVTLNINN